MSRPYSPDHPNKPILDLLKKLAEIRSDYPPELFRSRRAQIAAHIKQISGSIAVPPEAHRNSVSRKVI